jgi:glutathione synthase/RimK-type ligase-like ATP-grasp enzyme
MIAIHEMPGDTFDNRWIEYCQEHNIAYKLVNSYGNDFMEQIKDCDAFMWHFYQAHRKDTLMARQLLYALEQAGKRTFPDFKTAWHFDDKVGQKYLLEALGAPLAPAWVFYDKKEALAWAKESSFPKVFKLRSGGGAHNVKLVKNKRKASALIKRAFRRGFPQFDSWGSLKERWKRFREGRTNLRDVLEGVARLVIQTPFARQKGPEKGYIYFQEFIAGNDHDIRVVVINNKAFAIKRLVRKNDFRASGSGFILYDKDLFDEGTIKLSFDVAGKLQSQCVAFDYVYENGEPRILEISYGFMPYGYDDCTGYWTGDMKWHEGPFNPYGWMVEGVLKNKS